MKEDNTEVYKTMDVCERYGINLDLTDYLALLNTENVNLENVKFEKDDYHIGLSLDVKFDEKTYDVQINYGSSKFEVVVENFGRIILEKDKPAFFENLEIDINMFQ